MNGLLEPGVDSYRTEFSMNLGDFHPAEGRVFILVDMWLENLQAVKKILTERTALQPPVACDSVRLGEGFE